MTIVGILLAALWAMAFVIFFGLLFRIVLGAQDQPEEPGDG